MKISEVIKEKRKELNMTQEELAKKLGVSRQMINRYENGANFPSMFVVDKLCETFNLSINDVLGGPNEEVHIQKEEKYHVHRNGIILTFLSALSIILYFISDELINIFYALGRDLASVGVHEFVPYNLGIIFKLLLSIYSFSLLIVLIILMISDIKSSKSSLVKYDIFKKWRIYFGIVFAFSFSTLVNYISATYHGIQYIGNFAAGMFALQIVEYFFIKQDPILINFLDDKTINSKKWLAVSGIVALIIYLVLAILISFSGNPLGNYVVSAIYFLALSIYFVVLELILNFYGYQKKEY